MPDMTLSDLCTEVQQAIYQVAGVSTQVYSEGLIKSKIQDAFITLSTDPDQEWKRFGESYITRTLDGTTGRTTVLVSAAFASFDDITGVYPSDSNRPLVMGVGGNPLLLTGNRPLQYINDAAGTDVIQILPLTATGDIIIRGRVYPTLPFTDDTVVPFDYLALKFYVAWEYMTEDATNMAAAELLRQKFENRYKQLSKMQMRAPIAMNGRGVSEYPSRWW